MRSVDVMLNDVAHLVLVVMSLRQLYYLVNRTRKKDTSALAKGIWFHYVRNFLSAVRILCRMIPQI